MDYIKEPESYTKEVTDYLYYNHGVSAPTYFTTYSLRIVSWTGLLYVLLNKSKSLLEK